MSLEQSSVDTSSNSEQSASVVRGGRQERCGESVILLVPLTLKLNRLPHWPPAGRRERDREIPRATAWVLSCTMSQWLRPGDPHWHAYDWEVSGFSVWQSKPYCWHIFVLNMVRNIHCGYDHSPVSTTQHDPRYNFMRLGCHAYGFEKLIIVNCVWPGDQCINWKLASIIIFHEIQYQSYQVDGPLRRRPGKQSKKKNQFKTEFTHANLIDSFDTQGLFLDLHTNAKITSFLSIQFTICSQCNYVYTQICTVITCTLYDCIELSFDVSCACIS